MNALLDDVLEAHGGLDRWNAYDQVDATIVTGGAFWKMKSVEQDQAPRRLAAALHRQRATLTPFGDPDWHLDYSPDQVAVRDSSGKAVIETHEPRAAFAGHGMTTPWNPLQRAYFSGYALWTYLASPFLLAYEGVEVTEMEPWEQAGETWRVLRAHFSDAYATHSPIQDFFFGGDFLLRRHDYNVDVAGGFDAAQLILGYTEAGGILLPDTRRAYTRGVDRTPVPEPLMVRIDISDVAFSARPRRLGSEE